jgi:hypothetical protein
LLVIGRIDPSDVNMITFDLETPLPRIPHELAFQIQDIVRKKTIFLTFTNEGALTHVMPLSCWKYIGYVITQLQKFSKSTQG